MKFDTSPGSRTQNVLPLRASHAARTRQGHTEEQEAASAAAGAPSRFVFQEMGPATQWVASFFQLVLGKGSLSNSTNTKRVPLFPMATGHLSGA